MANIMSLKNLRNKPSRNGFDLSQKKNFTAKVGELLPVITKEVLPGDKFIIDLKAMTRTAPLNTAASARIKEYYDWYFVPYELLYRHANTVLTQMYDNPQHATELVYLNDHRKLSNQMPYVTCSQIAEYLYNMPQDIKGKNILGYSRSLTTCKLLEYLGYGNFERYCTITGKVGLTWDEDPLLLNANLSVFNLLAYQKIYADYYRDSQWEINRPSTFNVDYLGYGSMNLDLTSTDHLIYRQSNLFDLRYCNWQKDLFHGVLPRQQYGSSSLVQLEPIPVSGILRTETIGSLNTGQNAPNQFNVNPSINDKFLASGGSLSILALRQAEFLQKWKEIAQSGNKDYKEQIQKHWNVSVGDAYSELCQYLGGSNSVIDINEVVNNNITDEYNAKIAGKGIGVSDGQINFESNGRYGVLMCIYHALPLLDYTTDVLEPMNARINAEDFAIPEFDKAGMQSVPLVNLMNCYLSDVGTVNQLTGTSLLGYAPRYIDYKTSYDYSVGEYKRSLTNWLMSYDNASVINSMLNSPYIDAPDNEVSGRPTYYPFFKVNPNSVNPIFSVEANDNTNTDPLWVNCFADIKVVRNLDTDGLPY